MGLRPGSPPGVEVARVGFRSHLVDEGMCGSPKPAVGGEGDGAKLDVEPLVIDDLVGGLVLGLTAPLPLLTGLQAAHAGG